MNFFDHKNLGNHLQLYPKVVKHPVYWKLQARAREYKKTQQGIQKELEIDEGYFEYLAGSDVFRTV